MRSSGRSLRSPGRHVRVGQLQLRDVMVGGVQELSRSALPGTPSYQLRVHRLHHRIVARTSGYTSLPQDFRHLGLIQGNCERGGGVMNTLCSYQNRYLGHMGEASGSDTQHACQPASQLSKGDERGGILGYESSQPNENQKDEKKSARNTFIQSTSQALFLCRESADASCARSS